MSKFRVLCCLAAGYLYNSSFLDKCHNHQKNFFKVLAELPEELKHMTFRNHALVDLITKYGIPKRDLTVKFHDFEVSYDNRTRNPNWVVEHLTTRKLRPVRDDILQYNVFSADSRATFTAGKLDYMTDEFERGQMAYKHNHGESINSFRDTFASTTIAPQNKSLNCGLWEELQEFTRYVAESYHDTYIFTGPIYHSEGDSLKYQVIGVNNISVPTHFFKLIIGLLDSKAQVRIGCFIIPNEEIPEGKSLNDYKVPIWVLENKTGINFFTQTDRPYTEYLPDIKGFEEKRRKRRQRDEARRARRERNRINQHEC